MRTVSSRKQFRSRSHEEMMQGKLPLVFCLCLLLVATAVVFVPKPISSAHVSGNVQSAALPESAKLRLVESYGRLPLSFELNRGQTDPRVKFLSRGNGYTLFLNSTEAVLSLKRRGVSHARAENPRRDLFRHAVNHQRRQNESAAGDPGALLRMKLVGANPEPVVTGIEELPGKSNYFIGNDPAKWRTNVATYRQVKYQDVYRGIDLIYYGNQRQLEYDFVVAPGADPKAIRLDLQGADKVELDGQGNVVLETGVEREQIHLHKPLLYQETNGARQEISGGFVLQDKHQVSFYIAAYDAAKPLVIDPVLIYSTYLGGSVDDEIDAIAVDSSGNAYVSGSTSSTDFPGTAGSFQPTKKSGQPEDVRDAFVAKLNPAGSALVFATYIGGSLGDDTSGIVVASSGNIYLTGNTESTDFPTTAGAFQKTTALRNCGTPANRSPCSGIFVTQLNPAGTALVSSTYLGGTGDEVHEIAVDSSGNAYVTGLTSAATFPTTPGAFQTSFAPTTGEKTFVTKVNPTGTALVYSTFLGGGSDQNGNDIAVDSAGNAYVTGFTDSTDFPTTAGAFQRALAAGNCGTAASPSPCPDAFVTKLNPAGTALIYSTYLGGGREDSGRAIAIDSSGAAYVTGNTNSSNFPLANAFQGALAGGNCGPAGAVTSCSNAFVTKLNPAGSAVVYSTYLGGNGSLSGTGGDTGTGIAVDLSGNAFVAGLSGSSNFPTVNPLPGVMGCPCPSFFAKLSPAGALVYSTPFSHDNDARRVVVDSSGNAYTVGEADSVTFPVTTGALQITLKGKSDGYIVKIADQAGPPPPAIGAGGIVNNASYAPGSNAVAPGTIVAIFGTNLTDGTSCLPPSCNSTFGANGRLNTTMSGAQVTVNGIPAPIFYATPLQLGIQIPTELTGTSANVQVTVGGRVSALATVAMAPRSPGIFSFTADGKGAGAITHADGSPVSPQNPARGGEIVILYATGLGQVTPAVPTGALPTGVSATAVTVTPVLDGVGLTPEFAGLAGCCVGLNQVNLRIPAGVRSGTDIPVALSTGGNASNTVTIAVQ